MAHLRSQILRARRCRLSSLVRPHTGARAVHCRGVFFALGADRVVCGADFLLVTFDYFAALGPLYMRAIFTDLLLT